MTQDTKIAWKWIRCPSVTTGGKEYFWFTVTTTGNIWVLWDRQLQSWTVKGEASLIQQVSSVKQGQKWVEEHYQPAKK